MVIDFHTHIFPEKIAQTTIDMLAKKANIPYYTNATADGIIASMDNAGVDISVILPIATNPKQMTNVNNFAIECNKNPRLISFGSVHQDSPNWESELERIKDSGLKGIKLHPDYQGFFVDDEAIFPIYRKCKELGLLIIFHGGVDLGFTDAPIRCTPKRMANVLNCCDCPQIIVAHLGGHMLWEDVVPYLANTDVYIDTSFALTRCDKNLLKDIFEKFGDDRILFGTDSPWEDQKIYVDAMKALPFGDKDKIFYKNAEKLLGL